MNLWAGTADAAGTRPWQVDTLATVLSGTKGLTSTCVHQLVERGELDLDAPVARYWPEFGQAGKEAITIAMVMSHRSGVIGPLKAIPTALSAGFHLITHRGLPRPVGPSERVTRSRHFRAACSVGK